MSMSSYRVLGVALSAIIISLAAIAMSIYTFTRSTHAAPSVASTSIILGQKFNWKIAEVADVQGNLFVYLGFATDPQYSGADARNLCIAKWEQAWDRNKIFFLER